MTIHTDHQPDGRSKTLTDWLYTIREQNKVASYIMMSLGDLH